MRRRELVSTLRRRCLRRPDGRALARRLAYFWVVWTALLLVHEAGHALAARRHGLDVSRVTIGAGPVLWSGDHAGVPVVLRLVPLVGLTSLGGAHAHGAVSGGDARWSAWAGEALTIGGGVLATLALALAVAGAVAARERATGRRWLLGRYVVADALVLTIFNFLPVPPLDGGRAVLAAVGAWRGAPLPDDALFWLHVGGVALAVVPMMLWTRWTARIDGLAARWGAPPPRA